MHAIFKTITQVLTCTMVSAIFLVCMDKYMGITPRLIDVWIIAFMFYLCVYRD